MKKNWIWAALAVGAMALGAALAYLAGEVPEGRLIRFFEDFFGYLCTHWA